VERRVSVAGLRFLFGLLGVPLPGVEVGIPASAVLLGLYSMGFVVDRLAGRRSAAGRLPTLLEAPGRIPC
jgi:hydrogenase/urease accessory protein HupE